MRYVALFLLMLLVSACSSTPSEQTSREVLAGRLRSEIGSSDFKIVTLQKTNGQNLDLNGAKAYRFMFTSRVEFPNGFHSECAGAAGGYNCALLGADRMGRVGPQPVKAETTFTGEILYQQTEKGWTPESLDLRQISVIVLPPTAEETAAYEKERAKKVEELIAHCSHLVSEAKFAAIPDKGDAQVNKVILKKDGQVLWNSVTVDDVRLRQYLDISMQIAPTPYLVFSSESGADNARVLAVRNIFVNSGLCGEG